MKMYSQDLELAKTFIFHRIFSYQGAQSFKVIQ